MSWKRQWPERMLRPKVRCLSSEERQRLLNVFKKEIELSPVLSSLRFAVRALRGRFYFEKVLQDFSERPTTEIIGRVTPLESTEKEFLLEVEKQLGSWYTVIQGTEIDVIHKILQDTQGTFHGLGDLDTSLRKTGGSQNRLEVRMLEDGRFVYADTGKTCTFHETLFHFFYIPINVIAEPRQWYIYHREPHIIEVSVDRTRILVEFIANGFSGVFSGICLYALVDGKWRAFTIKPNQSRDIDTAVEWLMKREWQEW